MSSSQAVGRGFENVSGVISAPGPHHPQWYAIRTRSRHEKMVSDQLEKQGIENFLPLIKRNRKWSDRIKEVELPLFAGYNFVRVCFTSGERLQVLKTHGVAGFVRTLLASKVAFEEQPFLKIGQRVRVRGGALDGMEGILSAHNDDRSLVISLEPIERSLSVRIHGYTVEPV
jgi:transcription antitermination factor NusG